MTGRMRLMLLLIALLISLLLLDRWAATLRTALPGRPAPLSLTDSTTTATPVTQSAKLNPLASVPANQFADLLNRPLFSPSRHGVVNPPTDVGLPIQMAPVVAAAPVAVTAPNPVLLGTVSSPPPGGAFLGDDMGGPIEFVVPGAESRGLRLISVGPDSAKFRGAAGEIELHLPITLPANGDE